MAIKVVIFGWAESVHIQRWTRGLQSRGLDIKLISLGGDPLPDIPTVVIPRTGPLPYIRHAGRAGREARAFKPDLVHAHYAAGFGLWGLMSRVSPLLVSVWGSEVLTLARRPWYRALIRRILTKADKVTVTGSYLLDAALTVSPGIRDKTSIIPFGVEIPSDTPAFPLPPPFRLCYLKRHRLVYGPDILLEALQLVHSQFPHVTLSMAGDGEMTEQLRGMAHSLGLDGVVTFPGFIDNSDIYAYLAKHHILVMPSRSEGFGVAVLEAAACGRPTVASLVGGVPEVVEDGVTGLLVPPEDPRTLAEAIMQMIRTPELCAAMGEAARRRVEDRYDWEQSLDSMAELYERVVHTARRK